MIFVGYSKETKGYCFFNPITNQVIVARTGHFLEKEFLARDSTRDIRLDEIQDDVNEETIDYSNIPMDIGNSGSIVDTQHKSMNQLMNQFRRLPWMFKRIM